MLAAGISTVFMGLAAVASQHRSVWVAAAAGVVAVMMLSYRWSGAARAWALAAAGALTFGALAAWGVFGGLLENLLSAATDSRSLDARSTSWTQLIAQSVDDGVFTVTFGQPSGSGYVRIEPNGLIQRYSPHNWYVTLFLRVGIVGLCAWLATLLRGLIICRRQGSGALFTAVSMAVYGWFYSVPWQVAPWAATAFVPDHQSPRGPARSLAGKSLARRRLRQFQG